MINYDKEYHPVIEDYICAFVEGTLSQSELNAFKEVLEKDEELKRLVEASKKGRDIILLSINTDTSLI